MRFSPAVNPASGLPPKGVIESLLGTALIHELSPGDWDYVGETEVSWDSQAPQTDALGRVLLVDSTGSTWWAELRDD